MLFFVCGGSGRSCEKVHVASVCVIWCLGVMKELFIAVTAGSWDPGGGGGDSGGSGGGEKVCCDVFFFLLTLYIPSL